MGGHAVKCAVLWLPIVLALHTACGKPEAERASEAPVQHPAACPALAVEGEPGPRSLILVLADTLRRDRLGAYGGAARTPAFDSLAEDGVRFTNVSAQAPWTKPSIATLFTGLHPSQHGIVTHPGARKSSPTGVEASDVLAPELVTLAEALSHAGWRTAAFVSNPWLEARFGFSQGFDVWNDSFAAHDTPGAVVTRAALQWLRRLPDDGRPYFLYLHYMDAHAPPYRAIPEAALAERREAIEADPRPVLPSAWRAITHDAKDEAGKRVAWHGLPANLALMELVYDLGVEAFDRALGLLLEKSQEIAVAHDAALVVTSDHGQALYERGWAGHGYGLFDDEISVPLVMRWPGLSAEAPVDCPIGLVDLRSTLCDLLGVDCRGLDQGHSLLAAGPSPAERIVLSEGVIHRPRHRAARDRRYKLLYEPDGRLPHDAVPPRQEYSLYDLETDPGQRRDLLGQGGGQPEASAAFVRLKAALESGIPTLELGEPKRLPLDAGTRERLEALGYGGDAR